MALLACLSFPASSQAPGGAAPLTLGDCIRLAEQAPSAVLLAAQEREIASRGITQAQAGFLPQARLSNGFIHNSPLLDNRQTFSFIPLNGIRGYSSLVTIGQDFDTSGRLRAEPAKARSAEDAAVISAAIARRDLRRAVATAYYRALLARRAAAILAEALEESRNFEKRTRRLYSAGEAARADVIKAAAQTALLEQSLNAARLDARLAAQDLASFWTAEPSADTRLPRPWKSRRPLRRQRRMLPICAGWSSVSSMPGSGDSKQTCARPAPRSCRSSVSCFSTASTPQPFASATAVTPPMSASMSRSSIRTAPAARWRRPASAPGRSKPRGPCLNGCFRGTTRTRSPA